ncbi:MAG TPA: GAF domain-containing protein, partial [Thermoanaerobaculia bacterium]|nr:GAF domain-containing protein [Thermoanaerobaculia bacterium]
MVGTPPGADVLGAHGALAAFERTAPHPGLDDVLSALLLGAGVESGLALDPAFPGMRAVRNLALSTESLGLFEEALAFQPNGLPSDDAVHALLAEVSPKVTDPRAIPITAGDEVLLVLVLAGPPLDPVGFASVVAHAAALLSRQRMADRVRQSEFELKYRVWELESIYDVGLSIARTLDLDSLADEILMKSVSLLNARNGTLVIRDVDGEGVVLVKDFGAPVLPGAAALTIPDEGFRVSRGSERGELLRGSSAQTLLGVPIRLDGKPFGALLVADKENRAGGVEEFNAADERLLKLFGNQAAIAIENARLHREALEKERIEREIELAAAI